MAPDPRPPRRHPQRIVYPTPSGWRAHCNACGWTSPKPFPRRHEATGDGLDHYEQTHLLVIQETP